MPLQIQGLSGTVLEVEAGNRASRIVSRPFDCGALGAYRYGGFTGILPAALGAGSEIFQFRWTDATRLAVVRKVRISASVSTTFFAAGVPVQIDLVKATGWTGQGTGGTAVTVGTTLKTKSTMGASLVAAGDIRIATTAALGAGTKNLEGNSMASVLGAGPITASLNGLIIPPGTLLFEAETSDGENPIILVQNEGFVVRSVAVPATGTWTAAIDIAWTEVTAF